MNFANKISTFRILTIPFFIACLHYSSENPVLRFVALAIFILAVLSDAVDGYIARKSKQKSQVGVILDPLADKLLLVSAFIYLLAVKEFPFWVGLVVISRDILIVAGTLIIYMVKQHIDIFPTRWGKLATMFQMCAVISVLLNLKFSYMTWWLAVFFTVVSGIDYMRKGFIILYGNTNHRGT